MDSCSQLLRRMIQPHMKVGYTLVPRFRHKEQGKLKSPV
jgi:hypothetical protein